MKSSILIAAALAASLLAACDQRPAVVTVPTPVPGPPGPAGATGSTGSTGSTGYTGSTGATGAAGSGTTIIVTPAASAPSS